MQQGGASLFFGNSQPKCAASQRFSSAGRFDDENATPPAAGASAEQFASSQQAADAAQHISGPRVEFVCNQSPRSLARELVRAEAGHGRPNIIGSWSLGKSNA